MAKPDPRQRVARRVRERREQLGLTQESLAATAGVSVSTIRSMEKWSATPDTGFFESSVRPVEAALHWAPGAFAAIEAGTEPTELSPRDRVDAAVAKINARLRSPVEDVLWQQIVDLAVAEGRNVNDVLEDAVDLYVRTLGPRPHP